MTALPLYFLAARAPLGEFLVFWVFFFFFVGFFLLLGFFWVFFFLPGSLGRVCYSDDDDVAHTKRGETTRENTHTHTHTRKRKACFPPWARGCTQQQTEKWTARTRQMVVGSKGLAWPRGG